jgi:hypothetical protein
VDPHPAVALGVAAVEAVDGVDDLVDRLAGELVAKDVLGLEALDDDLPAP